MWVGEAVDALMLRRDIIRRTFRGTGVGIDVEGKEKGCLRFPGYETYEGPEIDEEHNDSELTDAKIKVMQKKEEKFQKRKKRKLAKQREEAKRKRTMLRVNKL